MADATLQTIRTKIRRLTKSPSTAQISDAQLDEYIDTFILYDFPEHLRTFTLRKTLTFYTRPYIDKYETSTFATDPLFNFKNKIITIHKPVMIAGYEVWLSQNREEFYAQYPLANSLINTGLTGDGVTTSFTGKISQFPILQNNVTFVSQGTTGISPTDSVVALTKKDVPVVNITTELPTTMGNLYVPDQGPSLPPTAISPFNYINYVTGDFKVQFPSAPATGQAIQAQVVQYTAARPQALLYFDNAFFVRPVPDQVYPVRLEVDVRPSDLMNDPAAVPELEQWWQYIAYGAAKKIFEDRMDLESVQLITPEFKKQELLVNRRTIVTQTKERTSTIYTSQTDLAAGNGYYGGGFGGF